MKNLFFAPKRIEIYEDSHPEFVMDSAQVCRVDEELMGILQRYHAYILDRKVPLTPEIVEDYLNSTGKNGIYKFFFTLPTEEKTFTMSIDHSATNITLNTPNRRCPICTAHNTIGCACDL